MRLSSSRQCHFINFEWPSCEKLLPTELHSPSPFLLVVSEDSILSTSVDLFLKNFFEDSEQADFRIDKTDNDSMINFYQNLPPGGHEMYSPFYDVSPEKQRKSELENWGKKTNRSL